MTFGQDLEIDRKTVMHINSIIQKKDVVLNHLQNKIQRLELRMGYIEQNYENIIFDLDNKIKMLDKKIIDIESIIIELKDVLFFKIASQEEITRHNDVIEWLVIKNNRHYLREYFIQQNNDQDLKNYILNKLEDNEMTPFEITNYEDDSYSYCEKYIGNIDDFDYLINWLNQHSFIINKILEEHDIGKAVKKVIENGFMTPFR